MIDKELLEIWNQHNNSARDYWIFMQLKPEERQRIFDLLSGLAEVQHET